MNVKVYLALNSELIKIGISQVLLDAGITIVGEDKLALEAVEGILAVEPQVVILSWGVDDFAYGEFISAVKDELPGSKFLILLDHPHDFDLASRTGADGYSVESTSAYLFPVAIQSLVEHGGWIGPAIAGHVLSSSLNVTRKDGIGISKYVGFGQLTKKENEVLRMMTEGKDIGEIAKKLSLSLETVRVHCKRINKKLNVKDRAQAVAMAFNLLTS